VDAAPRGSPPEVDGGRGEGSERRAGQLRADAIAVVVERELDYRELGKTAYEVRPGHVHAQRVEAALEVDLQVQDDETADDVPDRRVVRTARCKCVPPRPPKCR
jgi:hypothetical protein